MLQDDDAKTLKQLTIAIATMAFFTVVLIVTLNVLF